jgi:glycosyltransferase involved in cell wall biosynthesis
MRIAIAYSQRTKVGGIETYLDQVIPELHRLGHSLAFFHEINGAPEREKIALPNGAPAWCVADLGPNRALSMLSDWRPDLIYTHGLAEPELEYQLLEVAPAVFFAHGYYGTCISGAKSFKTPNVKPCDRRFGWRCLLHYYPHRCGGLSPVTMLTEYRRQAKRLELLSTYRAIVTLSTHMRDEYINHGFSPERVHCLPSCCSPLANNNGSNGKKESRQPSSTELSEQTERVASVETSDCWRLLFLGRMDSLKGGELLIDALPQVCKALIRPVRLTFAGDGPERRAWEQRAKLAQARSLGLAIEFLGWVNENRRDALLSESHLLVVPSVWPEPFGLVGPEAGLHGVPTAAFAVGGIPEWLSDGVNGYLAPADPPDSNGLAEAITKCLCNSQTHARLRRGAIDMAQRINVKMHSTRLLRLFERVVHEPNKIAV